ncbi:hypothetical protein FNV43_RR01813 [Rhamnella rubrinervis]|uniref:Uncharacterized protein n=1 Tax=Rhamnella rubrinervis TaxID=2594499 RepID=A0A8K0HQB8_9ROSA|nr:hypothetical protein FNV43_RR01813 [Rhamnella rubrinervis]
MDSHTISFCDSNSPFDCIVFDLDDTLYPANTGIASALKKNIDDYLVEKFGFSESKASSHRVELFKTYGSTLAGLRALGHDIDADDYHRLPYDSQLRNLLFSIAQRKIIFTNSDRNHAVKVLERLGLSDCFEQIVCFESMNPNLSKSSRPDEFPVVLKPSMDAMNIALSLIHVNPRRTLFLDDNVRNIAAARAVGLRTVLVGKTVKTEGADYVLDTINNLGKVIPELWVSGTDGGDQRISRTRSDIDSILTTTAVGA